MECRAGFGLRIRHNRFLGGGRPLPAGTIPYTGGFIIGLFILLGSLHKVFHHHGDWAAHWHGMTDSERREFIERRRREHHMFHHSAIEREDAAQ